MKRWFIFIFLLSAIVCRAQQDTVMLPEKVIAIDEVLVKGSIPMYSVKPDRLRINVARTMLAQSGTAEDVLRKSARVTIQGDKVVVLGRGEAIVLVDGRRLPSNSPLASISSNELDKIEIIINPSAKYDAEGKAVIEITTKKAAQNAWGAEITTRVAKGDFWRGYAGLELSVTVKDLSLYGLYAIEPEKVRINEAFTRDYTKTSSPQYIENNIRTVDTHLSNRFRFAGEYRFDDRHTVGFQVGGSYMGSDLGMNNVSRLSGQVLQSLQWGDQEKEYTSVTAFYDYISSSGKVKWSFLIDESLYDYRRGLDMEEGFQGNLTRKRFDDRVEIDIMSVKTDGQIALPHSFFLDMGIKISASRQNSANIFGSRTDYFYKEEIGAFYLAVKRTASKWGMEAGVRFEAAKAKAALNDLTVQDSLACGLFPNLSVKYTINDKWVLDLSYASRITRPVFQDLNPASVYIDSLAYSQGNPRLRPEIRHSIGLKAIFAGYATFGISYTAKCNAHSWFIEQDAERPAVTRGTQININHSDVFSVDVMMPYQNRLLTTYLATGFTYTVTNDRKTKVVNFRQPMWYCYSGLEVNLPCDVKLNTSIGYYTKAGENIFVAEPMFRMDAGVSKLLLKNKLNISLLWDDIFRTADIASYATMNGRYLHYSSYNDLSAVKLSVSYCFNKRKSEYHSRSENDQKRIKGIFAE